MRLRVWYFLQKAMYTPNDVTKENHVVIHAYQKIKNVISGHHQVTLPTILQLVIHLQEIHFQKKNQPKFHQNF